MKALISLFRFWVLAGVFCWGSLWTLAAQEGEKAEDKKAMELAKLLLPEGSLKALAEAMVDFQSSVAGSRSEGSRKEMSGKVAEIEKSLAALFSEEEYRRAVADIYAGNFSGAELDELIAFYKSDVGSKLVKSQAAISKQTQMAVMRLIQEGQASEGMEKAIASRAGELKGEVLEEYNKALKAEPFPDQEALLAGKWHGKFKDETEDSVWNYERRKDGTMTMESLFLYPQEKEYDAGKDEYLWKSKGRVIYEMMLTDPEWVDIFLIDGVSKKSLQYRTLVEESDSEVWEAETDLPGFTEMPKAPEGWKDISAE